MKAPVFLSCSHAVFAFCCFSAFPRTVPRLFIRRYRQQATVDRLNLHFAPRGQARRQVDD